MRGLRVGRPRAARVVAAVVVAGTLAACEANVSEGPVSDEAAATTPREVQATETGEAAPTTADASAVPTATEPASAGTANTAVPSEEASAEESTQAEARASGTSAEPSPTAAPIEPANDVIVVSDFATFTTPAQAAYCLISAPTDGMAASISCEVAQSSVPPGEPLLGVCDAEGIGWFFNFYADMGHGGFFCNHIDGITRNGGNPHYWKDDPWIDPDNVVSLASGARVAVLDYGRVMQAGDLKCTVQPDGLTCNADESGHGFTVNSASYTSW